MLSIIEALSRADPVTIELIRSRLPLVRAFLALHKWSMDAVSKALMSGQLYSVAMHSQLYLLAMAEGPLKWTLWLFENDGKDKDLGALISRGGTDSRASDRLPDDFREALYGTSAKKHAADLPPVEPVQA